jgi:hypothetical protein
MKIDGFPAYDFPMSWKWSCFFSPHKTNLQIYQIQFLGSAIHMIPCDFFAAAALSKAHPLLKLALPRSRVIYGLKNEYVESTTWGACGGIIYIYHVYTYIYIHIVYCMYVCIYIYTMYIYIYTYILYVYIYIHCNLYKQYWFLGLSRNGLAHCP